MLLWSLAWLSGLAFALLMAVWQHRDNVAEQALRFEAASEQLVDEIKTRMGRYAYGLRGARGLVIGAGHATLNLSFPARGDLASYGGYPSSRRLHLWLQPDATDSRISRFGRSRRTAANAT